MHAVILAGGLGTRLKPAVSDRPKPMAEIKGKPFLEYVINRLKANKVRSATLCVSYMKDKIVDYFSKNYGEYVRFSVEETPLGTGGALKNAEKLLPERFLLLNGDTHALVDYQNLLDFHEKNKADVTVVFHQGAGNRGGRAKLAGNRLLEFVEKGVETGPGLVNSGVYVVERSVLAKIPKDVVVSWEKETLPALLGDKSVVVCGYVQKEDPWGIDMGDPQHYDYLQQNVWLLEK